VQHVDGVKSNSIEKVDTWAEHWIVSDEGGKGAEFVSEERLFFTPKTSLCSEIVTISFVFYLSRNDEDVRAHLKRESTNSASSTTVANTIQHVESLPTTPISRADDGLCAIAYGDSSEELHRDLIEAPTLPSPRHQVSTEKESNIEGKLGYRGDSDEDDERSPAFRSDSVKSKDKCAFNYSDRRSSIMSFTYLKQPKILSDAEAISVGAISRAYQDEVNQEKTHLSKLSSLRTEEHLPVDEKNSENELRYKKTASRYELCQPVVLLGTGRYGQVLKVEDKEKNAFAQKIIKKEHLTDEVAKMQFMSEVSVLSRCQHPNLVRMFEQAETVEAYLITLELCLGSARTFFRDTIPLSEQHTQYLVGQLIQGVDYLHRQGVMHRDLKLGNILMASPFHLKLADFGLSKVFSESQNIGSPKLVRTNTNVGTQFMKAPEQLAMLPYSFKIDCWAIGIITWQFMIGGMPFLLRSKQQVKRALRSFRIPHKVSDDGTDFLERLLKVKEEDRASSFNALSHPFVFNPPQLSELQKNWPHPFDDTLVEELDSRQLTPRQYISQYKLSGEDTSDSDC